MPIAFPNYALLEAAGTVYLLVDDTVRPFASSDVLRGLGFNSDEILAVTAEELAPYDKGEPIVLDSSYPEGAIFQHDTSGTYYLIQNGRRHLVATDEIRKLTWGTKEVHRVGEDRIVAYPERAAVKLPDGLLVKSSDDSRVYVISDGTRRLIPDEETFRALGWKWELVKTVLPETLRVHPEGLPLESSTQAVSIATP